jgi:hypothetical protein
MKDEHFQRCQVETPQDIVRLLWQIASLLRQGVPFARVADLGAGDARFAEVAHAYEQYIGVERDKAKLPRRLPKGASVVVGDALLWKEKGFDLCIGNPPYIRHHHLEPAWRTRVLDTFKNEHGVALKRTANLFVLFLMQALQCTTDDGLVVQLVPFEWVTRPSAKELRDYIERNKWDVTVLRFNAQIFPRVLTTASVSIIDKRARTGRWNYGEIGKDGVITPRRQPSGRARRILSYSPRPDGLHGLRGLSPGGQDIFVLTEEERLQFSLKKGVDVRPCVTSLRNLPADKSVLDSAAFQRHYVAAGKRCWLIRSDRAQVSPALEAYLAQVGDRWKVYTTCTNRATWWRYKPHPSPHLLFASGFVGRTAKVVINQVDAVAVGSVYGVFTGGANAPVAVARKLRSYDFVSRVVSHSNNLKKVEVRQLNAALAELEELA